MWLKRLHATRFTPKPLDVEFTRGCNMLPPTTYDAVLHALRFATTGTLHNVQGRRLAGGRLLPLYFPRGLPEVELWTDPPHAPLRLLTDEVAQALLRQPVAAVVTLASSTTWTHDLHFGGGHGASETEAESDSSTTPFDAARAVLGAYWQECNVAPDPEFLTWYATRREQAARRVGAATRELQRRVSKLWTASVPKVERLVQRVNASGWPLEVSERLVARFGSTSRPSFVLGLETRRRACWALSEPDWERVTTALAIARGGAGVVTGGRSTPTQHLRTRVQVITRCSTT